MTRYVCDECGFTFDEVVEGISWDELPRDWCCPHCGVEMSRFKAVSDETDMSLDDALAEFDFDKI